MTVQSLVEDLRQRGAERGRIEVKSAEGGCPKSLRETVSAFANGQGGTVILGLTDDFQPTAIDADRIRDAVSKLIADDLEPPVRGEVEIESIDDGHRVVVLHVPVADPLEKPVYVKDRGRYGGSYIRSGDGDRRLTHYEIDRLLENRTQPHFDREPVQGALPAHLNQQLIDQLLHRVTLRQPRVFNGLLREDALRKLGVLTVSEGQMVPTLAGLITYGTYPQEFFPQLFISVVVLPSDTLGEPGVFGERFIDNQSCDGPIPVMIADAINVVMRNGQQMAIITEQGRTDQPEYPGSVVRELLANAIMHRDYSPQAIGTQIQVELYPNRLVVRSPGGIYGTVNPADFGQPDVSSSRNMVLAKLLADTTTSDGQVIAENRGSGIPHIIRMLEQQGMAAPRFEDRIRSLTVTVERQRTHPIKQKETPAPASHEDAMASHQGQRPRTHDLSARQHQLLNLLSEDQPTDMASLTTAMGLNYRSTLNTVNQLINLGLVVATAPPRSRNRRYLRTRKHLAE